MLNHVLLFLTPLIPSVKWKDGEPKMDKEKYLLYNAQLICETHYHEVSVTLKSLAGCVYWITKCSPFIHANIALYKI